jgi:hypothetical protein
VKLPSVYTDLCFQHVSENAMVGSNSRCRWVVNSASCDLQLLLNVPVPVSSRSCIVNCEARFTEGRLRQLKNTHNSIITENRAYIYINCFVHEDLGYLLLQSCPQVMSHPVYTRAHTHTHIYTYITYMHTQTHILQCSKFLNYLFCLRSGCFPDHFIFKTLRIFLPRE